MGRTGCPSALAVVVLLSVASVAWGQLQLSQDGELFAQELARERSELLAFLQHHPDLIRQYFPGEFQIPTDFYRLEQPLITDYTMNVIFDPCRDHDYNCCSDTYGTPEYLRVDSTPGSVNYGTQNSYKDTGELMNAESIRRPDDGYVINETCTGPHQPWIECVEDRMMRTPFPQTPICWNYNESIVSNQGCRAPLDGSSLPLCMEVGITQNAYIVECGGAYATDPHCGTFLEIHRPNGVEGTNAILSETRLRGQYPSGYRMAVISTTYLRNQSRVLCKGDYEIWWVFRTRYDWVVQRKAPFRIISPQCEWDDLNNRYLTYAEVDSAVVLAGLDPLKTTPVLHRVKTDGTAAVPGKGMGGTLVITNATRPINVTRWG